MQLLFEEVAVLSVGSELLYRLVRRNVEIMYWLFGFDSHEEFVIRVFLFLLATFWAGAQAVVDDWFLI